MTPVRRSAATAEDLALFRKVELFRRLPRARQAQMLQAATAVTIAAGTIVWRRGSRPNHVYILLKGRIGLLDVTGEGGTVVDLFFPGAAIGGVLALKNRPYLFSGQALDEVRALKVPLGTYRRWLLADRDLLVGQVLELMDQWSALTRAMRDLKRLSATQRLAHYLVSLADRPRGPVTVRLGEDLDLTARILGMTRESLSRSFAQLRRLGVRKRAKLVVITDPQRLRVFAQAPPRKAAAH